MATKKTNGASDSRVLIDREEHDALLALKQIHAECDARDVARVSRNHDLALTCNAQAARLIELDRIVSHHERVNGLQKELIDLLRGAHPAVASLEDLSEFWRRWTASTEELLKKQPQQRGEVTKMEPDLFRSWKLWVRDAGRASRTFAMAGTTRAEVAASNDASQETLQDRMVNQQRAESAKLAARVRELEAEVEAYRNAAKAKAP